MSDMSENDLSFWQKFEASLHKDAKPHDAMYLTELAALAGEKPIRYEEFYYLLSRYPYLDLHHPDGFQPIGERKPQIITTKGGWEIQDFGDRIRTSPGRFLWGAYRKGDDDDGSGGIVTPKGALTEQMIEMAEEMIAVAIEKGWPEAVVLGGFYGMIRAAWIAAEMQEYKLSGFDPSESDAVVDVWVRRILDKKQKEMKARRERVQAQITPTSRPD